MALRVWEAGPTLGGGEKLVLGLTVVLKGGVGASHGLGDCCGAGLGAWLEEGPNLDLDPIKPSRILPSSDSIWHISY